MTSDDLHKQLHAKRAAAINRDYEEFRDRLQISKWTDDKTEALFRLACLVTFSENLSTRINLNLARKSSCRS